MFKRDYDKEPIVIEDYNPQIAFYSFIFVLMPLIFSLIYFFGHSARFLFAFCFFIIPPLKVYLNTRGKRKIVLTSENIKYYHEENILKNIYIKDVTAIRKGFQDYYTERQNLSDFGSFLTILFFPFIILVNVVVIVIKTLFHFFFFGGKYRFYDSFFIIEDDEIINIMPISEKEYREVCQYFKDTKNVKCDELKVFFKYSYGYEMDIFNN